MGKGKPYSKERKLKENIRFNVTEDGIDHRLEHECRVKMAEDDLRAYFVDRLLEEHAAAARQALEDTRREEAVDALAAAAQEAVPAPDEALPAPALDAPVAAAAQEDAPVEQAPAAGN